MFGKLIPDSLYIFTLACEVSSWVRCFETTCSTADPEGPLLKHLSDALSYS